MSTTPAPIGPMTSHVLPPSMTEATSIGALARVGTANPVFVTDRAEESAPVMESVGEGDEDDYSRPVVMPGLRNPAGGRVATAAAPIGGMSEDEDGGVLGDYARVAAMGNAPAAPAPAPAPQKQRVNERVMTLGELVAERARRRDPPQVVESEHTGLSTLMAMFPRR